MTAHSVLNVHAAPEWGNSELYNYYERNGLGYGTVHQPGLDRIARTPPSPSVGEYLKHLAARPPWQEAFFSVFHGSGSSPDLSCVTLIGVPGWAR